MALSRSMPSYPVSLFMVLLTSVTSSWLMYLFNTEVLLLLVLVLVVSVGPDVFAAAAAEEEPSWVVCEAVSTLADAEW